MKRTIGVAATLLVLAGTSGVAVAAASAPKDRASLAGAEMNIANLLRHYHVGPGWRAQFNHAVIVQNQRLAVVEKEVNPTPPPKPRSYQNVSLASICNAQNSIQLNNNNNNNCQTSTGQVGTSVLSYVISENSGNVPPNYTVDVQATTATTCRSIEVQWGIANDSTLPSDETATVQLVQSNTPPQNATVALGQIGDQTFAIGSGPWILEDWVSDNSGVDSPNVLINATLSCYTPSGG